MAGYGDEGGGGMYSPVCRYGMNVSEGLLRSVVTERAVSTHAGLVFKRFISDGGASSGSCGTRCTADGRFFTSSPLAEGTA